MSLSLTSGVISITRFTPNLDSSSLKYSMKSGVTRSAMMAFALFEKRVFVCFIAFKAVAIFLFNIRA
ncbi:hypothetical protein D3C73_1606000 [compost metagenome]